jgi:caa(3)-type oxidase subunit IV
MHDSTNPSHAAPKGTIIGSYVALLFFTAVMVGLSRLNVDKFGIDWLNLHAIRTSMIMGTALIMGIIVSMFLMGLRYESKLLNLTIFLSNFVFLLIFVLFTWVDTSFRGEVDPTFNEKINWTSPVKPAEEEAKPEAAAPAAAAAAASEAPASAQPVQPADSTVHKAEDAEAKKNASAVAPQNPAQAKPENPAQATQPAKTSAPKKNPPSPNPAKPGPAGNTEAPKQPAPAGH